MTVKQLIDVCGFTAAALPDPDREVSGVYIGDLLSWVMGRAGADEGRNLQNMCCKSVLSVVKYMMRENHEKKQQIR